MKNSLKNLYKNNFKEIDFFNISVANGLNSFLVPFLVVIYGIIKPSVSAELNSARNNNLFNPGILIK